MKGVKGYVYKMTAGERVEFLPDLAVALMCGAHASENFEGDKSLVGVTFHKQRKMYFDEDYADGIRYAKQAEIMLRRLGVPVDRMDPADILHARRTVSKLAQEDNIAPRDVPRVLMMLGDVTGCGYYRIILPQRSMDVSRIHSCVSHAFSFEWALYYDIVVVQRIYAFEQLMVLPELQAAGVKVVYETDDHIHKVPAWNPYAEGITTEMLRGIDYGLGLADLITVTTPDLRKFLGYEEKTVVLPNSLDFALWANPRDHDDENEKIRILWAGSHTHSGDFRTVEGVLKMLIKEFRGKITLVFMGWAPPWCRTDEFADCVEYHPPVMVPDYPHKMQALRCDMAYAPIIECEFNNAKSNIKFLEYSAAGLPSVCSKVGPYKRTVHDALDGFLVRNDDQGKWHYYLRELVMNRKLRKRIGSAARKRVLKDFNITKTAKLWEDAYRNLVGDDWVTKRQGRVEKTGGIPIEQRLETVDRGLEAL